MFAPLLALTFFGVVRICIKGASVAGEAGRGAAPRVAIDPHLGLRQHRRKWEDAMRRFGMILAAALLFASPAWASRQTTCILLGDSIDSYAVDGRSSDLAAHLIEAERNVVIRNLSSPGASLGGTGPYGFNSPNVVETLDRLCGFFRYCDCVIIAAGSNDFGTSSVTWANVEQSVTRILDWAQERRRKVLMLDLIWRATYENETPNHMGMRWAQFRTARGALCTARARICTFAPRPQAFNVATPSLFAAEEQQSGGLTHLNAAGHRVRATWIEEAADGAGVFAGRRAQAGAAAEE
jgi:lysophospholipase L1-like esterase